MNRIDLNEFGIDDSFYGRIHLVCTVKSFDLQAIRERYLASRKTAGGRVGSVERRKVSEGGIVSVVIEDGKLLESEVLVRLKEPRGIAGNDAYLGIAAENVVFVLDGQSVREITDPWFSYIHTLDFHPQQPAKVLVSSSGFDCIFEFDAISGEKSYEWFAWENGLSTGHDPETSEPLELTRDEGLAEQMRKEGKQVLCITDPKTQVLPTAKRAAFINSVVYDQSRPGYLLATLFHRGEVGSIDMATGHIKPLITGMKNPHGGRNYRDQYLATSTGTGEVIMQGDTESRMDFSNLPGKPEELGDMEWLQNSLVLPKNDYIVTIDSNRNSFVVIDPERKVYSKIPYDLNWAVQDFIVKELGGELQAQISGLKLSSE